MESKLLKKEGEMEEIMKDYIRSFICGEGTIPAILMKKDEFSRQASVNGLVLALAQSGVLMEEIRRLLGVPDHIQSYELMSGTWMPTREITLDELFKEVDQLG